MDTENNYPNSLVAYYHENKHKFIEKTDGKKQKICYALIAFGVLGLIFPGLFLLPSLLVRLVALGALIYAGWNFFMGFSNYHNKDSDGKITDLAIKRFDVSQIDEERIVELFNNGDFTALAKAPSASESPIHFYVEEDTKGKVLYCLIRKFFSDSEFKGITEVKELSGSDYDKFYADLKTMADDE